MLSLKRIGVCVCVFGFTEQQTTITHGYILISPSDEGFEKMIVPEVTCHARSQMSKCHTDTMNQKRETEDINL